MSCAARPASSVRARFRRLIRACCGTGGACVRGEPHGPATRYRHAHPVHPRTRWYSPSPHVDALRPTHPLRPRQHRLDEFPLAVPSNRRGTGVIDPCRSSSHRPPDTPCDPHLNFLVPLLEYREGRRQSGNGSPTCGRPRLGIPSELGTPVEPRNLNRHFTALRE